MAKKRVFISFDYDHDEALKNLLVGQSRNADTCVYRKPYPGLLSEESAKLAP
jgi:hypothetical protein